jgi:hypothetical protein
MLWIGHVEEAMQRGDGNAHLLDCCFRKRKPLWGDGDAGQVQLFCLWKLCSELYLLGGVRVVVFSLSGR